MLKKVLLVLLIAILAGVLFLKIGTRTHPEKEGTRTISTSLCMGVAPEDRPTGSLLYEDYTCDTPLNAGMPFVYQESTLGETNMLRLVADVAVWTAVSAALVLSGSWNFLHIKKKK